MSTIKIKSLKQAKNLKDKTVLVRCDFDVPIKKEIRDMRYELSITDDSRLKACLPTIKFLLNKKCKIILCGHLGRPNGKVVPSLSLEPVAKHLEKILSSLCHPHTFSCHPRESGDPVDNKIIIKFISNINGIPRRSAPRNDNPSIIFLENLRFNPDEEKNDKTFAKKLASLADIYVNEAFAVSHRSAASVDAIKKYLPSYAGLNLEKEIKNLSIVLDQSKKPLVIIIGGAKIETKLPVIKKFLKTADYILIGGAVANDFLLAQGMEVGDSLVDKDYIKEAKKILEKLRNKEIKKLRNNKSKNYSLHITHYPLLLPIDFVWHKNKILDIGDKTIKNFCAIIKSAKTIVWNGPMGYFENKKFANGTKEIAKTILDSKAKVIIGGGETAESLAKLPNYKITKLPKNIFISTGGGAMLEFLSGKKLPGLK